MYVYDTKIRVRYADTDRMGYVYYGNYPEYIEVGRTEALRALSGSYKNLEDRGVFMLVHSMFIKYIKPAFYDDLLTVKTIIKEIPTRRMFFEYEIYNEKGDLLCKAETTLAFVSKKTGKTCRAPEWFSKLFDEFF